MRHVPVAVVMCSLLRASLAAVLYDVQRMSENRGIANHGCVPLRIYGLLQVQPCSLQQMIHIIYGKVNWQVTAVHLLLRSGIFLSEQACASGSGHVLCAAA